ncbi:hypothetical protein PCAR4_140012 [Paraburkholderia caribensis]|nr:hypothetical protein PCAR4_140012 [Paraburkholderia caribensis]
MDTSEVRERQLLLANSGLASIKAIQGAVASMLLCNCRDDDEVIALQQLLSENAIAISLSAPADMALYFGGGMESFTPCCTVQMRKTRNLLYI